MRPPLPALLFFGCLGAAAGAEKFLPLPHAGYSFWAGVAAGSILLTAGAAIATLSIRELLHNRTTIEPSERPSHLVTSGPFRLTRNPMYLSLVVALAGFAVMTGSIWFVAACVVLLIVLDAFVIRPEERVVRGIFGAEYIDYCRRVRRWI